MLLIRRYDPFIKCFEWNRMLSRFRNFKQWNNQIQAGHAPFLEYYLVGVEVKEDNNSAIKKKIILINEKKKVWTTSQPIELK